MIQQSLLHSQHVKIFIEIQSLSLGGFLSFDGIQNSILHRQQLTLVNFLNLIQGLSHLRVSDQFFRKRIVRVYVTVSGVQIENLLIAEFSVGME